VHLEARTKPHVHQKFEIFWAIAYPNFQNGPKNGLCYLGINNGLFKEKGGGEGKGGEGRGGGCEFSEEGKGTV
jgi:hypothetical protein